MLLFIWNNLYIHIKIPTKFLLTFLDAKSSVMMSISISSNKCFSMHNIINPFNLSYDIVDLK